MWNLTIEFDNLVWKIEFVNKLRKINDLEYYVEENNNKLRIICNNDIIKESFLNILAYEIITTYKSQFLKKYIQLSFLKEEHVDSLINALVMFDIDSDIYYVINKLEKFSYINLNSFDIFILSKIKPKWNEFVLVTNFNGNNLLNHDIYIEFLKFLINSIQPKNYRIGLKYDFNNIIIVDDNNMIVCRVEQNDEIGLITNLVLLAPQNIDIHCVDKVSDNTFKTLLYLFDKKINLKV